MDDDVETPAAFTRDPFPTLSQTIGNARPDTPAEKPVISTAHQLDTDILVRLRTHNS